MKTLQLLRRSVSRIAGSTGYALECEITSSQGITKKVFVKSRLVKNDASFKDTFYAVATPQQIEQLPENAPVGASPLFRDNKLKLYYTSLALLEADFIHLTGELRRLVDDMELLDEMNADGLYSITATEVEVNMAAIHTHYRIPLTARPCGINDVYTDIADSQQKHRILSVNTALQGWIPVGNSDPGNTYFKYNIATDTAVTAIWPPSSELLSYAHIEVNGVTTAKVLVNADGIFWKSNLYGDVPWPKTYVNVNDQGAPGDAVTLVLDVVA